MCIAILNTKSVTLKKKLLNNCWENNGDGAGILYTLDGKMQVFKEMTSFDKFYNEYLRIRKEIPKQNIVLHFRISTHGKINETNCHPFLVHDELGFVHNGMIYDVPTSKDYSDTYMFNEQVLKNLKHEFEYNETMLEVLESFIGSGSKLIFLNSSDDYSIVNEKAGHWNMNCWFSNSSYKQVNDYVDYGGTKKYKSNLGFGTAASPSRYGYKSYGYGVWSDRNDLSDFYKEDLLDEEVCEECSTKLYGEKELTHGICNGCYAEYEAPSVCEYCELEMGDYNASYNAHLCEYCIEELEGYEVDEKISAEKIKTNHSLCVNAKNKTFSTSRDLNIIECTNEHGTFTYDSDLKLWIKKETALGA
jgi:predicted glutamine amidotransferase